MAAVVAEPVTAEWAYHFYDRRTGERIDTLPVENVRFGQGLNQARELSGQIPVGRDGLDARRVRDTTIPERTMCFVQRDNALVWGGYVTPPRSRALGGPGVQINARETLGLLERMFMPTVARFAADQVDMARFIAGGRDPWLELAAHPGPSGLVVERAWSKWDHVPVMQALTEMSEAIAGIEFTQQTTWDEQGRPRCQVVFGTPRLGARPGPDGLVLEYNHDVPEAGNVESGEITEAPGMATRTWVTSETDEGVKLAAVADRPDLRAAGFAMIERHETFDGVPTTALLQRHADALQAASSAPKFTASFTIIARQGMTLGDIRVGDDVRVRVTDPWWPAGPEGEPGLDTWMRIVGIGVQPDAGGVEKYNLEMADMSGWL